jgi:hypothetical protein
MVNVNSLIGSVDLSERDRFRTSHVQAQSKSSFCEAKEAKNFFDQGLADVSATVPVGRKFLAPLFFKKAAPWLVPT